MDHLGSSHGLSVVLESYFGVNDIGSKPINFQLYIHQSGSVPDMLNSTSIKVSEQPDKTHHRGKDHCYAGLQFSSI